MKNKSLLFLATIAFFVPTLALNGRAQTNGDNCSGSCKSTCATYEEPSTDAFEYCATSGQKCCVTKSLAATCSDAGGTCKSGICDTATETTLTNSCSPATYSCCAAKSVSGTSSGNNTGTSSGSIWNVESLGSYGLPSGTITGIIQGIVSWALEIFGFLGIIAFVISGIWYLTAAGDAEQEKKAKLAMKMAIMGIAVALAGFVIIKAIDAALNAKISF